MTSACGHCRAGQRRALIGATHGDVAVVLAALRKLGPERIALRWYCGAPRSPWVIGHHGELSTCELSEAGHVVTGKPRRSADGHEHVSRLWLARDPDMQRSVIGPDCDLAEEGPLSSRCGFGLGL